MIQYNAHTQEEFVANFPVAHFNYLQSLPWYIVSDQYLFVHAGLRLTSSESVESQLDFLTRKDLSNLHGHTYSGGGYGMPDQLVHKGWCRTNDPNWGYVVVTGHNKYAASYLDDTDDFVASHRIGFHSCACAILINATLPLHCALLPRGTHGSCVMDYPPHFFSVRYCDEEVDVGLSG